jgi:hypothetical protein
MDFGLDDIGEFIGDVPEIPGDVVDAAASMFDGPGGVAGIFVSGAVLLVGGPTALVPALIAGVAVTEGANALIRTRRMNAEEQTLAWLVYGDSLPPWDQIILTNLIGLEGRAFTIPNPAGECLINLGEDFDDPIRSKHYIEHGRLLIHELDHAWQIHHSSFKPGLICAGAYNQAIYNLAEDVYNPGGGGDDWSSYNLEQQATLIDLWYAGFEMDADKKPHFVKVNGKRVFGCSPHHPFYRYAVEGNGGSPPPAVQAMSVRGMAQRKFGMKGSFSVSGGFPRSRDEADSLRRRMIGLAW